MSRNFVRSGFVAAALLLSVSLAAQDLMVYPAKGQSQDQQEQDQFQCYTWARDRTGFDPMEVPRASSPEPEQKGGAGRGAEVGAVAAGVG